MIRSRGEYHRLTLSPSCSSHENPGALLARDGYVCGKAGEYLETASGRCPIVAIDVLSAKKYRSLQREILSAGPEIVEVDSLADAFRGSSARCLDPTRVRSWSVKGDSLIVRTSRVGTGGHRAYRVELSGLCPEAGSRDLLTWRSSTGLGRICGIPGEYAVFSSQHNEVANVTRAYLYGRSSIAESQGCPIRAVVPIDSIPVAQLRG